LARLSTAPTPVRTAQPIRQAEVSDTEGSIGTSWSAFTTVYSAKAEVAAKLLTGAPSRLKGVVRLPRVSRQ